MDKYDRDEERVGNLDNDPEVQELVMEYELLVLSGEEESERFLQLQNILDELYCPGGEVPDPI